MRLLMVGANSKYAIEIPYLKYLKELLGSEKVELFEAQNMFLKHYQKSILNKILYRLGYHRILSAINEALLIKIESFKPDVILVFKGMEIFPKTLLKLKHQGILLANYNPDNPFIFSGRGSGNKNITQSIHIYDVHFTYSESIKVELIKTTKSKVFILPFGYDIDEGLFEKVQKQKEILKTCFIGNPDIFRAEFITELANKGIEVDVYGQGWNKFVDHHNIFVNPPVYSDELWKTLYRYRIQLNLMRPHNLDSHNMRTFEIPAIGGIELAPDTLDHRNFFNSDSEIFLFENIVDCVSKIGKLLEMSEEKALQIRMKASQRCIHSKYSYYWRSKEIANCLEMIKEPVI